MKLFFSFAISILVMLVTAQAIAKEQKSAFDIDYKKYTLGEQILIDFMYEIEPKLIAFYDKEELNDRHKIWSLKGIAMGLRSDNVFRNLLTDIEATDPEATFVFEKLPQKYYPNLHSLVKYFRLKKEYKDKYGSELTEEQMEQSRKLYEALFGKKYDSKITN